MFKEMSHDEAIEALGKALEIEWTVAFGTNKYSSLIDNIHGVASTLIYFDFNLYKEIREYVDLLMLVAHYLYAKYELEPNVCSAGKNSIETLSYITIEL